MSLGTGISKIIGRFIDWYNNLLNINSIQFNLTPTGTIAEGQMGWNSDDGTLNIGMPGGVVKLQIGQEMLLPRGKAIGSDIDNGELVYVSGASGSKPELTLAQANAAATSERTIAMATEDILQNANGYYTSFGIVRDIPVPTATFTAGDAIYLSPTVAGGFTNVMPEGTDCIIFVGYVLLAHDTEGMVFVNIQQISRNYTSIKDQTQITGINDPTQYAITYDASTRQFTVVNSGTTVAVNGVVVTPEDEVTTAHADTTQQYWAVYESGNTTLTVTTTPDILTQAIIGRVYYNTDQGTPKAISFDELHSQQLSAKAHYNEHMTEGAKLVVNPLGCTMSDYTIQPPSPADSDNQFSLSAGVMLDEDIKHVITALATGEYSIAYRAGTDVSDRMDWDDTTTVPLLAGTYIYYNQLSGGTWGNTELTNNQYVNYFVFAWTRKDHTRDIIIFMGQDVHATLVDAQAEGVGDVSLPSYLAPEQVPLYRITFRAGASYSTTGKVRIEAVFDYRGTISGAQVVSGSAIDHQSLINRSVDGHPNNAYLLGRSGGQTLYGSTLTGETLILGANAVDTDDNISIGKLLTRISTTAWSASFTPSGLKLSTNGVFANIIRDEDDMASDDATALATQQSIKAFVEALTTRTIFVDKKGNDSNTGSSKSPLLTIGAAVTLAKTLSPLPSQSNPVAIIVNPGRYNEQVTVDYVGINLYGFGQGITDLYYAGTALTIEDNGVDPEPTDMKVVGISIQSTTSAYSVVVQGVAGTTLAGNELQFRDSRLGGSNSIYINLANYIDYQNAYIMGAQLYEQVAGVWFEDSESGGAITIDYDTGGDQPSDTGNYGLFFVRHLPRGAINFLNDGKIGEDLRPVPYEFTAYTKGAGTVAIGDTVKEAIQKLDGNLDNKATSGANTDITSLQNTALEVGRDADNKLGWDVDDTLKITINSVLHSIASITDGAGNNDKLITQGYVDDKVVGLLDWKGSYDASTNTPDLDVNPSTVLKGDTYVVTVAGTFFTEAVQVGDTLIAEEDNPDALSKWTIVETNAQQATTTVVGLTRYVTQAEVTTGTETQGAITPDALKDATIVLTALTVGDTGLTVGVSIPFSDSSGTLTLQNVDAIDATTKATLEAAITVFARLAGVAGGQTLIGGTLTTQDLTLQDNAVDGNTITVTQMRNKAESGANTDITSLQNTSLEVGRDADNKIGWDVDDTLKLTIAGVLTSIVNITTGAGDNDKLATQGYIDDATLNKVTAASNITDNAIVRGDGGVKGVQTTGVLIDDNNKTTFPDSATYTPLNITARSSAPSSPAANDIYLDDGTNTANGDPAFRRYTGSVWEDLGAGSGGAYYIDQSGGTSDTYGVLAGTINGVNTTFTVSQTGYDSGSLQVYLNGQLQIQGSSEDWTETTPASGTFDFNIAPVSGDEITVSYGIAVISPNITFDTMPIGSKSFVTFIEEDTYYAGSSKWLNVTSGTTYDKTSNPEYADWFTAWGIAGSSFTIEAFDEHTIKFSSGAVGTLETDAMQGHKHNQVGLNNVSTGGTGALNIAGVGSTGTPTSTPVTDGVSGTPRTASVTRMKNIAIKVYVKIS